VTEQDLLEFFGRQAGAVESGDLAGLLEHYAADAIVIRTDRVAAGCAEIEALFRDYIALRPQVIAVDAVRARDDTIVYQARLEVAGRERVAAGALILRDGKIWRQIAAFDPPLE
jgi:ketosteroid isomerase-like protein